MLWMPTRVENDFEKNLLSTFNNSALPDAILTLSSLLVQYIMPGSACTEKYLLQPLLSQYVLHMPIKITTDLDQDLSRNNLSHNFVLPDAIFVYFPFLLMTFSYARFTYPACASKQLSTACYDIAIFFAKGFQKAHSSLMPLLQLHVCLGPQIFSSLFDFYMGLRCVAALRLPWTMITFKMSWMGFHKRSASCFLQIRTRR